MSSDRRRPRQQQKLLTLLDGREKVSVYEIYSEVRGKHFTGPARPCQQALGSLITRFNRWGDEKIVPGPTHYTYTLLKD